MTKANNDAGNKPVQPKPAAPKPARPQSQIDEERGDWEGMGQSRFQPEEDAAPKSGGKPTPGANSLAATLG